MPKLLSESAYISISYSSKMSFSNSYRQEDFQHYPHVVFLPTDGTLEGGVLVAVRMLPEIFLME